MHRYHIFTKHSILILMFLLMTGCVNSKLDGYNRLSESRVLRIVDEVYSNNCTGSTTGFHGSEQYNLSPDKRGICLLFGKKDNKEILYAYGNETNEKLLDISDLLTFYESRKFVESILHNENIIDFEMRIDIWILDAHNNYQGLEGKIFYLIRTISSDDIKMEIQYAFDPHKESKKLFRLNLHEQSLDEVSE